MICVSNTFPKDEAGAAVGFSLWGPLQGRRAEQGVTVDYRMAWEGGGSASHVLRDEGSGSVPGTLNLVGHQHIDQP